MRLATFNLFSGRPHDATVHTDPELLAEGARLLDADVLGIQEVDRGQARSGYADQTKVVADALGAGHWRFAPAVVGTPGTSWRPARPPDDEVDGLGSHAPAAYGVGVVSRLPVLEWHVLRLRPVPVVTPVVIRNHATGRRKVLRVRDEPRIAVAAVLSAPDGPLTFATTHLTFVPGWNVGQLRRLTRWLRRLPSPQILVGDLNLPAPLPRFVCREWRSLVRASTWPVTQPKVQLDHVLARGPLPAVAATDAVRLPLSDHRALTVDLGS